MAADLLSLVFQIKAVDDATQHLESVKRGVQELAKTTTGGASGAKNLGNALGGASAEAKALGTTLQTEVTNGLNSLINTGGPATQMIGRLGASLGGASVVAGAAALAFAGVAAAMLSMTHAAINAGGELFDLSKTTNLSVETLAGLKVAATTGGASLEQLANAFVRLQRQAAEGSPEFEAALNVFGLTATDIMTDLEASIDRFLVKFSEIGPSSERTAAAIQLFGRQGATLTAALEDAGGGLEELRAKAQELGISFTKDGAAKADEFGDQLDLLKLQASGLWQTLGQELLPTLRDLLQIFQDVVVQTGLLKVGILAVGAALWVMLAPLKLAVIEWRILAAIWNTLRGNIPEPPKAPDIDTGGRTTAQLEALLGTADKTKSLFHGGTGPAPKPPEKEKKAGGAKQQIKDLSDQQLALNQLTRAMQEAQRVRDEQLAAAERALVGNAAAYDAYYDKRIEVETDYVTKANKLLDKEKAQIESSKLLPKQRQDALEALEAKRADLNQRSIENQQKFNDDRIRQEKDYRESTQREYDAQLHDQLDSEKRKLDAAKKFHNELKRAFEEAARDREKAERKEQQAIQDRLDMQDAIQKGRADIQKALPGSNINVFGVDPTGELTKFQAFGEGMRGALGDVSESMGNFRDIAAGAFGQVAQAAQQVLAAFILTGKGGSFAIKKMTADVIAAIATQSAVKSIFELAEGFAALANPITAWEAPFHFAAAKFYAIVAGVATGIGLAIGAAGGLGGGGGPGGAGGAGFGGGAATPQQQTLGRGDITGQIGGVPAAAFDKLINALDANTAASQKIISQPAGEVFVQGAAQRPDAAASAVVQQARTNAEFVNQFGRVVFGPA